MIKGGKGGSKTTLNGLRFESRSTVSSVLCKLPGYKVEGDTIFFQGKQVAEIYAKNKLYEKLLKPKGVDYKQIISKRLLPDDAIMVLANNTLHIIEIKFQSVAGSVDEKLQTCDFKNKQYQKLMKPLNLNVKYCYVLNDWFKKPEYADVLVYIQSVGCYYFFKEIPLSFLGLPASAGSEANN